MAEHYDLEISDYYVLNQNFATVWTIGVTGLPYTAK